MAQKQAIGFPVFADAMNITNSKITLDGGSTYIDLVDAIATAEESGTITLHTARTDNPHSVTKTQVGLGSADNTADADKPVSTAQATAISTAVPLTTRGDLLTRGAAANSRLALGTSGYHVQSDGTDAAWSGFTQAGTGAVARPWQDKGRDFVSVFDFMTAAQIAAVKAGTLSLTVTTAVQAALDSGAKKIWFPLGAYKVGALTVPNWVHLIGETMPQGIGAGDGPVRLVFTLASGTAITCAANPVFENITFKNAAGTYTDGTATLSGTTATCILTNGDAQLRNCNFYFWAVCCELAGGCYYFRSNNVEFARCTTGYSCTTVAPYDVHIEAPTSRLTAFFITGNATYFPRNIKILGGSIEGYSKIAQYFIDISFFGTYFETVVARDGCVAIDPLGNGASVSLFGCLGYLDHTARFVNLSGLTNCMLTSSGNVWDGAGRAAGIVFFLPSSGTVRLGGDKFGTGHPNDCLYVDRLTFAGAQCIDFPALPAGNTQAAYGGLTYLGGRGFSMNTLTAAPSSPVSGMMVLADGSTWDPLARAYGRPYWVAWQGDRWRTPGGLT